MGMRIVANYNTVRVPGKATEINLFVKSLSQLLVDDGDIYNNIIPSPYTCCILRSRLYIFSVLFIPIPIHRCTLRAEGNNVKGVVDDITARDLPKITNKRQITG